MVNYACIIHAPVGRLSAIQPPGRYQPLVKLAITSPRMIATITNTTALIDMFLRLRLDDLVCCSRLRATHRVTSERKGFHPFTGQLTVVIAFAI